jgi:hypothetical protein
MGPREELAKLAKVELQPAWVLPIPWHPSVYTKTSASQGAAGCEAGVCPKIVRGPASNRIESDMPALLLLEIIPDRNSVLALQGRHVGNF